MVYRYDNIDLLHTGIDYDNTTHYSEVFSAQAVSISKSITVFNDSFIEATEAFTVSIELTAPVSNSSITMTTIVIQDDDGKILKVLLSNSTYHIIIPNLYSCLCVF